MIKFKCNDCGSEKYKIVRWKLKYKPDNIGVYCNICNKWFKFLGKNEEMVGFQRKLK